MKYTDLRCIACGREFTTESPPDWNDDGPPKDGLLFISYGNYGSTVYDPQSNGQEYLTVIVCDECVVAAAKERNVLHICKPMPQPRPPARYRGPWLPPSREEGSS